jgi:hypothetical protein
MIHKKIRKTVKKGKKRGSMKRKKQRGGSEPATVIIIEPRKTMIPALEFVVNNVLDNLESEWKLIVFPGSGNKDEVEKILENLSEEKKSRASICDIGLETMNQESYNKLMMSERILEKIPTEMFLVVQTDSLICKQGKDLLKKFMKYDYVGAPWKGRNAIGNGGFSLRRKSVMLEILKKCPTLNHNEDGFFSGGCEGILPKKPTPEEAKEFSIETIDNNESFGIHKAWEHLPDTNNRHNSQCLGYSELRRLNTGTPMSLKRHTGGSEKRLKIGLMTIFKNESMVLKEWIEHYKWQGVDVIILLNNDSTDDWKSITDQFKDFVTVKDVPGRHMQMHAYNTVGIPFLKEQAVDVMIVADVDEYYFGKDGRLLKDYIQEFFTKPGHAPGFTCGWSMFGSNGHKTQPQSIREGFTMRWRTESEPENGISGKTIMLLSELKNDIYSEIHIPELNGPRVSCPNGLQLNHYTVMSKEYFDKVKQTRGDAHIAASNSARNEEYFNRYDKNNVSDTVLADQVKKLRENPMV